MSLIESLIGLALLLLFSAAALQAFVLLRTRFDRIRARNENREAVLAALTRLRFDLAEAGLGLSDALSAGLLEGVSEGESSLVLVSLDRNLEPASPLVPGQTALPLRSASAVSRGRRICLMENTRGETVEVTAVLENHIVVSPPLEGAYSLEAGRLFLLRDITYLLDETFQILRRRVNASSAQPLMEEACFFEAGWAEDARVLRVTLVHAREKEREHVISLVPKNLVLPEFR